MASSDHAAVIPNALMQLFAAGGPALFPSGGRPRHESARSIRSDAGDLDEDELHDAHSLEGLSPLRDLMVSSTD